MNIQVLRICIVSSLALLIVRTAYAQQDLAQVAPAKPPIYQNRDEPGRNPYQQHVFGCESSYCTFTFRKVPVAHRRVITNVTCSQFVPNGASVYVTSLGSSAASGLFIPLLFSYAGPYNGGMGSLYLANMSVLAYFDGNTTPSVTLIAGNNNFLANAHCNLSGYDIRS